MSKLGCILQSMPAILFMDGFTVVPADAWPRPSWDVDAGDARFVWVFFGQAEALSRSGGPICKARKDGSDALDHTWSEWSWMPEASVAHIERQGQPTPAMELLKALRGCWLRRA
jgi:hypothetical protein